MQRGARPMGRVSAHIGLLVASSIVLSGMAAAADPIPGDVNGDGAVDFSDFLILAGSFGGPGDRSQGDLTGDGRVDFLDLLLLAGNFGMGGDPVVEPSGVTYLKKGEFIFFSKSVSLKPSAEHPTRHVTKFQFRNRNCSV